MGLNFQHDSGLEGEVRHRLPSCLPAEWSAGKAEGLRALLCSARLWREDPIARPDPETPPSTITKPLLRDGEGGPLAKKIGEEGFNTKSTVHWTGDCQSFLREADKVGLGDHQQL